MKVFVTIALLLAIFVGNFVAMLTPDVTKTLVIVVSELSAEDDGGMGDYEITDFA